MHRGVAVTVPVVARRTSFVGNEIKRTADSTEFEVAVSRVDGERETWAYLGDGPGMFIEVSAESAARLMGVLADSLVRSR